MYTKRYALKHGIHYLTAAARSCSAAMFTKFKAFNLLLVALFAPVGAFAAPSEADEAFRKIADEFLHGYFAFRPLSGVSLGLHEYDGQTLDYSRTALAAECKRLQDFDTLLSEFAGRKSLSTAAAFDYRTLQVAVQGELFGFEDARAMASAAFRDYAAWLEKEKLPRDFEQQEGRRIRLNDSTTRSAIAAKCPSGCCARFC